MKEMTLWFVSIGLADEKDMSIRALEIAKRAHVVFWENYTQPLETTKKKLETIIGKEVVPLTRKDIEEGYGEILSLAKDKEVALLVGGDAFCATTHTTLRLEALRRGIETKVVHSSSIFSAIGETGLHIYKFGAVATIPFPERTGGKLPKSVYEVALKNFKNGFHTLFLLDIDLETNRFLSVKDAFKILKELEKSERNGLFNNDTKWVVVSRLGFKDQIIAYGTIGKLVRLEFKPPSSIILPAKLHFTEEEYLKYFEV